MNARPFSLPGCRPLRSLSEKCRRHEMFIDEKCSWFSRSSELSEMLGISLNSEENKMGVRASYKHYAATRLFFRQTPPRAQKQFVALILGLTPQALRWRPLRGLTH